jgi:hypothetical protein
MVSRSAASRVANNGTVSARRCFANRDRSSPDMCSSIRAGRRQSDCDWCADLVRHTLTRMRSMLAFYVLIVEEKDVRAEPSSFFRARKKTLLA